MASFGSSLRRTRLGRGISLDDVARDTRLTKRCLQAFEDESILELPGEPYNRAYLRTYSAYLGLDSDDLVSDYERETEAQTKAGRLAVRPDVLTAMRQAVERRPLALVGERRLGAIARTAGLVGVAVTLLVGLVWVGVSRLLPSSEPAPVGTSMLLTRVSETGNKAPERDAVIPEPSRRLDAGPASIEVAPPPRLDQAPASVDIPAARLSVPRSGVGTDVVDRELVGRSDTFHVGTRVIFWTFVTGGGPAETIRHVWIHEGRTAGAVDLTVAGPSWRTQSRRTLVPGTEGEWAVEALDSEGRVLVRHEFRCEVL